MKKLYLAGALLSSMLFSAAGLHAQGIITGTLTGTVQDSTGAVLPASTVVALNVKTGVKQTSKADGAGVFLFPALPVGEYTLTIAQPGFGDLKLEHILIDSNKSTSLGAEKLATGSAQETVDVSAGVSLLETTQAQVTTTFDSQAVTNLPTGGGLDQLALLVPGVASTHGDNFSNTNGVGLTSNGQRGRSNNFELDGQSNNDNSVAGEQVFFENQDAIQELQVITNNFSAQYGRNMGSVVNYITKSGTNQIHGSAFEYYTGSWLSSLTQGQKSAYNGFCQAGQTPSANNCTTPYVPRFTDNTYGGTLGFPILKDKLFGFGSALFTRDFNGLNLATSGTKVYPTPTGLQQLAAEFPGNPGVVSLTNQGPWAVTGATTPYIIGTPTNAVVCASTTGACPTGTTTTVQVAKYGRQYHPYNTDEEVLGRLDYQATNRDRLYLRYFYQNAPGFYGATVASGGFYNTTAISHSVGSDWTHTFGPRWVNQVRYSFQQSTFNFDGGGFPNCTVHSLSACPSTVTFSATNASYGDATNVPQGRTVKVTQVQDNATWSHGKHAITFGGEFDYQNSPNVFLPYINGGFIFSNINSMLAQTGTLTLASGASPNLHFTEPDGAAYLQDDWKVSPSLTLNLGLRYEIFGQSLNVLHNISLANQTGSNPQWNTSLPLSTTTFPYIPLATKNFQPRVGFAFNPQSAPKLVIRGGFAINFDPAFYNIALNSFSAAPVVNQSTVSCAGICLPSAGTLNAAVHAQDDALNPVGGNPGAKNQTQVTPRFHNPYAESYTLGVQYQVLRAATLEVRYSGNHTIGNFQSFNGNPTVGPHTIGNYSGVASFGGGYAIVPAMATYFPTQAGSYCTTSSLTTAPTATQGDLGRRNCGLTNVRVRGNTAFSIYNSLQTSLTTRNMYGFTGVANWTYGRTIDNTSEVFSTGGIGNSLAYAQNPNDINVGERGLSAFNYKNVTSVGLTYSVPTNIFHNKLLRTLGGLEVNTLYSFNSGQPYQPAQYYYSLIGYYYSLGYLNTAPAAGTALGSGSTPVQKGQALFSTCDYNFNLAFVSYDACRPFVGNKNAPQNTVAFNTGSGYIDANGNPIQRNQARYVVNNLLEEQAQGTPYGNMPRNPQLGDSYNNVNFSVFKDFKIREHYNLQLQAVLFNALNRGFYGSPDILLDDASNLIGAGTFNTFIASSGTANGPTTGSATGARNIQLAAKFLF